MTAARAGTAVSERRRLVLGALGGVGVQPSCAVSMGDLSPGATPVETNGSTSAGSADPQRVAQDEAHWAKVAQAYDRTEGIANLEHGYWGRMARPVRERNRQPEAGRN
ncbi:MAG: hypothetical protein AAGA68_23335 [Pseudomonadota bacterium]